MPLAEAGGTTHVTGMANERTFSRTTTSARPTAARGPVIDQDGRVIAAEVPDAAASGFRFDFGNFNFGVCFN